LIQNNISSYKWSKIKAQDALWLVARSRPLADCLIVKGDISMSPVNNGRLRAIASFSLCLAIWFGHCLPLTALPQADEQTAIRRLALAYFAAYQKKDVEALMSLWSAKSPDVAATRQSLQQTFAATEKIALTIVKLGKATVEADRAKIRIDVEINATEAKTGKPAAGFGKLHRTLELVKEGGEWKVWRSVASEEEFAAALVVAGTEEERKRLLVAENELVTVELRKALMRQGQGFSNQGRYAQALSVYQLARQIAEQIGDASGVADAWRGIGGIHYFQGNYTLALEYSEKSLKLAEQLGDKALMTRVLRNIGAFHYFQGNNAQALEYYQRSFKLSEELGDKAGLANTLGNVGTVYYAQGNNAQALDYYQKSLKLSEELGDNGAIARALTNIGNIYNFQGNYLQAIEYYQKSLKLSEELGYKLGIAIPLLNIGNCYELLGDYERALDYYQKNLKLSEELEDKSGIALALHNIGNIDNLKGNYTQALDYYQKSLKLSEELGDKAGIVRSLVSIGGVYELQGSHAKALEVSARAAALAGEIGRLEWLGKARTTAGKAYRALDQPAQARLAFADAISTTEKLREQVAGGEQEQQRFFEDKLAPYYQMIDLLVSQRDATEALAYAERAKGRVLLDVLRSGRANINRAMTAEEQSQERQLNSELVSLNSQIYRENVRPQPDPALLSELNARLQKARLEYESFQTSLYAAHPELKVQRGETPPLSLNEAAQLLPADGNTALLEYAVADDNSFLFVLTKAATTSNQKTGAATLRVYPLNIKSRELIELVETFQKRLGERNLAFNAYAQRLYGLLLKPAEAQLRGKEMLCIVPDGVLWQLPFQALKPTPSRYLIEDRAIFYAPSLSTLREMMKPAKRTVEGRAPLSPTVRAESQKRADLLSSTVSQTQPLPTLLAFGNPLLSPQTVARQQAVYRDEELGALPEAEREVKALRELYGAARSRVYVGAAAREARVKAEIGDYRIVHFATHGILDNRSPLYSHLLLAQEPYNSGEDGLLEAREIMEMDLQAELVVLSACQTAGGRVGAGEGMIGMTWALFVAGCPTTLVSQWKVDTRSTSKLMVEFHSNLQRQHQRSTVVSKAQALRQAMLTLLKSEEYELPYYWAPFVLVGDGF
jgi:CHAT domain-containing protein/tetratricopeptide (TPR) repeat protein